MELPWESPKISLIISVFNGKVAEVKPINNIKVVADDETNKIQG